MPWNPTSIGTLPSTTGQPVFGIDTSGGNYSTGGTTITLSISATAANEIIIVGADIGGGVGIVPTVVTINGAGLTWNSGRCSLWARILDWC